MTEVSTSKLTSINMTADEVYKVRIPYGASCDISNGTSGALMVSLDEEFTSSDNVAVINANAMLRHADVFNYIDDVKLNQDFGIHGICRIICMTLRVCSGLWNLSLPKAI